ncbi:MAG: response regulator [Luteolibacter sp.]
MSVLLGNEEADVRVSLLKDTIGDATPCLKKIVVVDDSKFLADILATFFQLEGLSAQAVYGGAEAVATICREIPDVAFVDLVMPDLSGMEVARHVRASGIERPPVLVALSAWEEDGVRREAKEAGFDYFLAKPVDIPELREFMSRLGADHVSRVTLGK